MEAFIAVKVIPYDFPKLISIAEGASGSLSFTTVKQGQHEALIELYVVENGIRRELSTEVIKHIPDLEPGHIRIQVLGRIVNRMFEYKVYFQRKLYKTGNISLKEYIPSRLPMYAGITAAGLLLIGASIWGIASVSSTPSNTVTSYSEKTVIQTPIEDSELLDVPESIEDVESELVSTEPESTETASDVSETTVSTSDSNELTEIEEVVVEPVVLNKDMVVRFAPESPVLTVAAKTKLQSLITASMQVRSIEIVGHCALYRDEDFRLKLSKERADNTAVFLRSLLNNNQIEISTAGKGGSEPLSRDPASQDINRRVEINITYTE